MSSRSLGARVTLANTLYRQNHSSDVSIYCNEVCIICIAFNLLFLILKVRHPAVTRV